jgi:hypothetical protein
MSSRHEGRLSKEGNFSHLIAGTLRDNWSVLFNIEV